MTVAIIGAGMAGLSAALSLQVAGLKPVLFDKGRGPGGRMSTRRAQTPLGEVRFDHGAQFFTARDPAFVKHVEALEIQGAVAEWAARFVDIAGAGAVTPMSSERRFVGVPGMNGIIRSMAADLDVTWQSRVYRAERDGDGWRLSFEEGDVLTGVEQLVVAVPAEQAVDLLAPLQPAFAEEAAAATSAPCWTVMLAFDAPVSTDWDAARLKQGPLSWMARNTSKPGRGEIEAWTLHASPDWSRAHLELEPEEVVSQLTSEFRDRTGAGLPLHSAGHRWRYAQITQSAATPSAWDNGLKLGVCGDWRVGARVEAAWSSGTDLARRILQA
ncbi:MAG: FAD-dependent oxidoreductase [Pseudomonadota bacterium]